ncbi:protein spindle-F [Plodia interpunctella]|uniref:protein spindle-F n=1 Tax=Plodia interpunctella TaxID=58824 RepID=UPI0023688842|nr:protein spindle-F [Plodia interpunctella]
MDSSSIVSFTNDTFQTTLKDHNNISVHELALHAMRDRCLLLQKRINALESDNMRLKLDFTKATESKPFVPLQEDEKSTLLQKIAELNRQKSQLMHHVFMVSCENKNLWTKISSIKGAPDRASKEYVKQPLLRTETYLHSTPKGSVVNYQEKYSESSLEEISLKLINSYIEEKSQLVEQYEQMTQLHDDNEHFLNVDSIGFNYIEDPAMDSLKEIHIHTEKLNNLKKELVQQESDLKLIILKIESFFKDGYKCSACIGSNTKIISSEHKEIETSDSLANWATPVESTNYNNYSELNSSTFKKNLDHQENNLKDDTVDKICPMCGQTFPKDVAFSEFQSHVENHFIGESDPDSVIDNSENVPTSFDNII